MASTHLLSMGSTTEDDTLRLLRILSSSIPIARVSDTFSWWFFKRFSRNKKGNWEFQVKLFYSIFLMIKFNQVWIIFFTDKLELNYIYFVCNIWRNLPFRNSILCLNISLKYSLFLLLVRSNLDDYKTISKVYCWYFVSLYTPT